MLNELKNTGNESVNQITRDNVLALDIAEHCGYYSTHEKVKMRLNIIKCFMTHWLILSINIISN